MLSTTHPVGPTHLREVLLGVLQGLLDSCQLCLLVLQQGGPDGGREREREREGEREGEREDGGKGGREVRRGGGREVRW